MFFQSVCISLIIILSLSKQVEKNSNLQIHNHLISVLRNSVLHVQYQSIPVCISLFFVILFDSLLDTLNPSFTATWLKSLSIWRSLRREEFILRWDWEDEKGKYKIYREVISYYLSHILLALKDGKQSIWKSFWKKNYQKIPSLRRKMIEKGKKKNREAIGLFLNIFTRIEVEKRGVFGDKSSFTFCSWCSTYSLLLFATTYTLLLRMLP